MIWYPAHHAKACIQHQHFGDIGNAVQGRISVIQEDNMFARADLCYPQQSHLSNFEKKSLLICAKTIQQPQYAKTQLFRNMAKGSWKN